MLRENRGIWLWEGEASLQRRRIAHELNRDVAEGALVVVELKAVDLLRLLFLREVDMKDR